ncbi:T9SS type A sorting domain-containing protein [Ignavibacterium sp.]|uniref:T9SS type A sorting domain-containing protein n=1 Tax=Ignavibacterium sp. TaxID=2651167 RepID=UPI00307E64BF
MKTFKYSLFVLLFCSLSGFTQVKYTWFGGNGSWQTASNWSPNGIPGAIDTAVINSGTVTNNSSVNVAGLFQNGGSINGAGNLIISDRFNYIAGVQVGTGTTTVASGATIDFQSSLPKTISRTLVVDGSLTVIGAGQVDITSGGQLVNNGTVDIRNSNSFGSADGSIINNGNFIVQTGTATIGAPFTNNGTITVLTGTLSFFSSLNNTLQGMIKGVGTITPGSNFTNDGTIAPGTSPGVLRVSGNYPQTQNARLNIEIGGYAAGTERDSLSVSQQAQLNGTLNIVFPNNFTPQIGDVFPFLSYQSRSGEFTQVNFPNNVTGYIQYLSNRAQIVIDTATSVDEEEIEELDSEQNKIPTTYELSQNYPNPFNPTTKISWQSPVGSHQVLKVFDVLGNVIATLADEYKEAGRYKVEFDASSLPSGVYIYKLAAGSFVSSKKMIVIK